MAERARPVHRFPPLSVLPALGWFAAFLLIPLAIVAYYSLGTRGLYGGVELPTLWGGDSGVQATIASFGRALDPIYLRILWNSVGLALSTALSCFIIGFPMAFAMASARPRLRPILLMAIVIPFWTNFVVRAYAIKVLLAETGPINELGLWAGWWSEPLALANSSLAVWLGMVTNYLPFLVLPLFVALDKFDFALIEAARDLGASSWRVLTRIVMPLNRAGILSGLIFVFTPALGEFVIPDLLGGAKTMLIGNLITEQFLKTRDWPFGAAVSLLLMALVMVALVIYLRSQASEGEASGGAPQGQQRPRAPWPTRAMAILGFGLLYLPLLVLMVQSVFKDGALTLEWYTRVLGDSEVIRSLGHSLWVGLWSTLLATVIGASAALAIERTRWPGRKVFATITHIPLILPEIVLGLALLIWFVFLRLELGRLTVILAHTTLSVSYVILTVRARLEGFDETLEEAARDLGASAWQTLTRVTLPLLLPGILSGALMAFTLSFDDFLVTFFTTGVGVDTLPIKIYSMIKFGVSREIHALSTLLILATLALVLVFAPRVAKQTPR